MHDRPVRGAYSLRGLTTPRQLVGVVKQFDVVVTADSFLMHAAHLCGVPAVVLWGPTDPGVYGYHGQKHIRGRRSCEGSGCISPETSHNYQTPCPEGPSHCMNRIAVHDILAATLAAAATAAA
jgi:ADP-heptose:LPS heptosyltransferase